MPEDLFAMKMRFEVREDIFAQEKLGLKSEKTFLPRKLGLKWEKMLSTMFRMCEENEVCNDRRNVAKKIKSIVFRELRFEVREDIFARDI